MKCPKCGYNSFDHLDSCKKCDADLTDHKEKFNLRGFYSPGQSAAPAAAVDTGVEEAAPEDDGSVDFGFDFLEEDEEAAQVSGESTEISDESVSIDQPFGADSESVPADDESDDDKPGKGPEFAF